MHTGDTCEKCSRKSNAKSASYETLTLVHDVLLQRLWVMRYCLIQILQKFAHAGNWDSKGLNKEKQLLWLQVLQG